MREDPLRLIEFSKVAECRDEIDPITEGRKDFVRTRGTGLIEQDLPGGGAARQQDELTN
jgi:hypothetical protein